MYSKPFAVRSILWVFVVFMATGLLAEDKQLGDYTLKYGYTYFTPSERSVQNGGAGALQKLPGQFKFWFNKDIDFFVRSTTFKASHNAGSWVKGAGDTFVGMDLILVPDIGKKIEMDFTYDVKLPTSTGFAAGEIDHEAIATFLKSTLNGKHAFELDLGDYIEGFSGAPAAHMFELTLNDEIQFSKNKNWTVVPEFDFTTASPDTPTEIFEIVAFKYQFKKKFVLSPGVRITDTPYTGRFSAFVSIQYSGSFRKHK